MNIVYLKDGTKCNLIEKTTRGYVVEQVFSYDGIETENPDEFVEEPAGPSFFVDKVYEIAPRHIVDEEIKGLQDVAEALHRTIYDKKQELAGLNRTIELAKKTVTDTSKMIINKSEILNAKRLTVWVGSQIVPRILDHTRDLKLSITYMISQYENEERCWSYEINYDKQFNNYSDYFDPAYGIKCNLTDDEILQITHERQRKTFFDDYEVNKTPDHWLIPENLSRKRKSEAHAKVLAIDQAKRELEKSQQKYNELMAETVVS